MKNFIKIFLASIIIAGLSACEDLDVQPKNFYSSDNFFETIDEAESGLIYAYDALTYVEYAKGPFYICELPTDNYGVKADEAWGSQELDRWKVTGTEIILLDYFRYSYIAINRANAVIKSVIDNEFSGAERDRILGEAYFLRAFSHFNLVRIYGLAPIRESLVDELSKTMAAMPKDMQEMYSFIIADLEKASQLMDINRQVGRADKVAAQALLAKAYLYMASAKESNVPLYDALTGNVDDLYGNAALYADSVINQQSEYGFDNDLLNIYNINNPDGPEHIFMAAMDRTGTEEGDYSKLGMFYTPYLEASEFYVINPDSSFTLNRPGWGVFTTNESFVATFKVEDKRRSDLMVSEIFDKESQASLGTYQDGAIPYRFTRKYLDPQFAGEKSSAKPYLMRFTDVLMIFAEAKAEGAEALEAYNKVRRRAGVEELADLSGLTKDEFRDLIIEERGREFAFEGDRLHDLRRKKIVQESVAAAAGLSDMEVSFYPIPQREIDLNPNID